MISSELQNPAKSIDILLVDDDSSDIELTIRALGKDSAVSSINVVCDGVEALRYLQGEGIYSGKPRPNLILLDLNMPRMNGRETLQAIKADIATRAIPVIVLTTSASQQDIAECYDLQASCFLSKSGDLQQFNEAIAGLKDFWFRRVRYPADTR